ncbi:MAG: hypothetical protein KGO96_13965 [Elusimicrobia bacterium]|nr:hypothetical protein [Elusimicrobiota bacterium]
MTLQYSQSVQNAQLNAFPSTVGASAKLQIWTGAEPANCAAAATGTKLVEMALPSTWMGSAASNSIAKSGTWSGTGLAAGTAGYFRIVDSTGTTCHLQGSVTATGGGGDLTLDNTSIASGQTVTVSSFSLSRGNS